MIQKLLNYILYLEVFDGKHRDIPPVVLIEKEENMMTDMQETDIDKILLTKLSICLWKLDSEDTSEGNFKDQDKAQKTLYKQKAKKLLRLLNSREIFLTDKN